MTIDRVRLTQKGRRGKGDRWQQPNVRPCVRVCLMGGVRSGVYELSGAIGCSAECSSECSSPLLDRVGTSRQKESKQKKRQTAKRSSDL